MSKEAKVGIFVLLGIVMILLVSVSARMVRRYVPQSSASPPRVDPLAHGDDWARKPLIQIDEASDDE